MLDCVTGASSPGLFIRTETTTLVGLDRVAAPVAAAPWSVPLSCPLACGCPSAVRPPEFQSCQASWAVAASFAAVPAAAVVPACETGPLSPGLLIRSEMKMFVGCASVASALVAAAWPVVACCAFA